MGQQQLLLIILVTILVGIAAVVALNVFGGAAEEANRSAVQQDMLQAASAAQAVWTQPAMMGGAGRDFTEVNVNDLTARLNIPGTRTNNVVNNENGQYTVTALGATALQIAAVPSNYSDNMSLIVCRDDDNQWQVNVGDGQVDNPCAAAGGG